MTTISSFFNFARNTPHVVKYAIHIWNIYHIMCLSSIPLEGAEQIQVLTHIARLVPDLRLALKYFTSRHTCPLSFSNQIYHILEWSETQFSEFESFTLLYAHALLFLPVLWRFHEIRRKSIIHDDVVRAFPHFVSRRNVFTVDGSDHTWTSSTHPNPTPSSSHIHNFRERLAGQGFLTNYFFSLMTFNHFPIYWYVKLIYLKW